MIKKISVFQILLLFNCNSIIPRQTPPIVHEARTGDVRAIKERIRNCENCAEKDEHGNNALHAAAQEGQAEIVDILTTQPDYSGWGDWFYSFFCVVTLPDKNEQNDDGETPLHLAIQSGRERAAECLLQKRVNTEIPNNENLSAPFSAIKRDDPRLIPLFIRYRLIEQKRNNGDNLLHYALKEDRKRTAEKLAEIPRMAQESNNEGKNAAIIATDTYNLDSLELLYKKGVNLDAPGRYGRRASHNAAIVGNYAAINYLLQHGINIDSTDDNGDSALLFAVMNNKAEIAELLLNNKADSTQSNKQGKDIFSFALQNPNIIKRIREHPAININALDSNGCSAFMRAAITRNHTLMNNLLAFGATLDTVDKNKENALHKIARNGDEEGLQIIIKNNPQLLFGINNNGDSPLFLALQNGRLQVTKLLIHYGSLLEIVNNNNETALHQASASKNIDVLQEILSNRNRPNIEAQDKNGFTALHYAAAYDNPDGMQMLIKHGAALSYTKDGDTHAHLAASHNAIHSLKLCESYDQSMRSKRNKYNKTPFLVATEKGNVDAANFLLCETDFISRDMGAAINIARTNGHRNMVDFLEQKQEQRLSECRKIAQQPDAIDKVINSKNALDNEIILYDPSHISSQSKSVKRYSTDDLYYMREAQRAHISLENTKYLTELSQVKMELEQKLYTLQRYAEAERKRIHEQRERERAERIRKEQEKELKIFNDQHKELERIKKEQQERERAQEKLRKEQEDELQKLNAQHNEINRIKEQQVELARIAKEKAERDAIKKQDEELKKISEQKKALDEIAQQKKIQDEILAQKQGLEHYAAQKALTDVAKHTQALEGQHVPNNWQASAPPMEEQKCTVCNTHKAPTKPLPCVKCKKKIEGICPQCIKEHKGRCPQCWQLKCFSCFEKEGVTNIPCTHCKKIYSSARICSHCLEACIKQNIELKVSPHRCPQCHNDTLDKELVEKIIAQK